MRKRTYGMHVCKMLIFHSVVSSYGHTTHIASICVDKHAKQHYRNKSLNVKR